MLLFLGWHFASTFFVPAATPRTEGWIIWPFGRDSRPLFGSWRGVLTPHAPPADPALTAALVLAAIASIGFLVGLAGLFGVFVPPEWWRPAVVIASAASAGLFVLYLGPWAILPLFVDAALLSAVLLGDWSVASLAGP